MTNSTLDITQSFDRPQKLLRLYDNGDGTYSIASNSIITDGTNTADVITGPVTGEKGLRVFVGPTDPISDLPVFIDFGQHQVHEGESYGWEYYSAAPATRNFAIVVPTYANTNRCPHLIMQMESYSGAGMLSIYEGATYTGGATATDVFNRNRNSANTPAVVIVDGVTSADGTKLPHTTIAGAAGKTAETVRAQDEIILKSNTTYVVRYEEITATTRLIIHLEWYEDLGV